MIDILYIRIFFRIRVILVIILARYTSTFVYKAYDTSLSNFMWDVSVEMVHGSSSQELFKVLLHEVKI